MKHAKTWTLAVMLALACSGPAWAQSGNALLIPGEAVARDIPGAKELPDPNVEYKVLFDVKAEAPDTTAVNPMLTATARYLNTLGKAGVPAAHRKIAVIFHQGGTDIIMNNEAYKARYEGQDNPNVAIIQALERPGSSSTSVGRPCSDERSTRRRSCPKFSLTCGRSPRSSTSSSRATCGLADSKERIPRSRRGLWAAQPGVDRR